MQLISDDYLKLAKQLHEENKHYGAIGFRHTNNILTLAKQYQTDSILDYGCGKSSLARNLPFDIFEYDPAIEKHSARPNPAQMVVCTDVLEHVEPENLDAVLLDIAMLMQKVGYLTVCIVPAKKTLPDGRNAHLIIESKEWWENKINEFFQIIKVIDKTENGFDGFYTEGNKEFVVIVEPQALSSTSN
jgi:hypothetical protein